MKMKPKIKISQSVINRLKPCKTEQCGALFGVIYEDTQYILGLFTNDDYSYADLLFPANVDMCGAYQWGPIRKEEVNRILLDVDVTDNPIYLSVPAPNVTSAYHVINNKLEPAPMKILSDREIYADFIHLRLQSTMLLTSELDVESVNEELLTIRKQISSGKLAFQCNQFKLYLLGENSVIGPEDITDDTSLGKIVESESQSEQEYSRNKPDEYELQILPLRIMKRVTVVDKNDSFTAHAPIIQIEQNQTKLFKIALKIDAISLVPKTIPMSKIYTVLVESACRSLKLLGNYIMDVMADNDNSFPDHFQPEIMHFYPHKCGHFVSRVFDNNRGDEETVRLLLHQNFLLPRNRPIFRPSMVFKFKSDDITKQALQLMNPHASLPQYKSDGEVALVNGNYLYFHYKQDDMDDDGWGCAYRSLQTLASWLLLQGYTGKEVPSFKQIQQCLYDIGDKPHTFVGSRQWIGSTEVNFVLESLLGITCKIISVSSGEDLASKGPDLVYHFQTYGSPIMIGGGVLAHTILGVDYNRGTGEIKFLILDPHYTGQDNLRTILGKGWCSWKNISFWDKKAYYNMCLPIVPQCV